MSNNLDYRVKRLEKGPLQRFRNQNAVLKKFGENGLKLYKAANGKKTANEIIAETRLDADFAAEVIAWLDEKGMIALITVEGEIVEMEKLGRNEGEEKKEAKPKTPKPEIGEEKEEEIKIPRQRSRLREIVEQEAGAKAAKKATEEEEMEKPEAEMEREAGIAVREEEITAIEPEPAKESEREEDEIAHSEEKPEAEEEIEPIKEEVAAPGEEEKTETEETEAREEAESKDEIESEEKEEQIEPKTEEEEDGGKKEEIVPEEEPELNPVERTIKEKYGDVGLKVYALIDGQKTAEEIMNETGVSEAKLIEMLEYMEKQGIIKLEHPEAKAAAEAEEEKEKFVPLAETGPGGQMKETAPVEVPSKTPLDMFRGIQIKAKIAIQYGEKGSKIFDAVDGKASDVDMALKHSIPLYEVRDILSFLASNRIITTRQLDRNEIAKRYGEDCFAVYKKYGKEGVLLYELIGKDIGIRQIARLVTREKDKFAEMFIFVHKVLGIDIPIDKDVVYSQLEEKKNN